MLPSLGTEPVELTWMAAARPSVLSFCPAPRPEGHTLLRTRGKLCQGQHCSPGYTGCGQGMAAKETDVPAVFFLLTIDISIYVSSQVGTEQAHVKWLLELPVTG